jgi:hypothetical protein
MVKKVIVAGVFIGGGIYLLKKLLPMFNAKSSILDVEAKEYEVKEFIPPKVTYTGGFGNSSSWERPDDRRFSGFTRKSKSAKEFLYLNMI